ncbi:MAG TPA: class I SAM-dependent methyltransferase [Acidobacteriaceae bacterium]|nr:class I SAM-dependent methyltransferase [Acidobacteriaceae bacterium]
MNYSPRCEETQGFSSTFRSFHHRLATDLIQRCDLHEKTILEIGCGKGEFISMLCALGRNRGIGFDPAFVPERRPEAGDTAVEFYQELYSERYSHVHADCIVCKMTLEHIPQTYSFMKTVRRAIGDRTQSTVFFQVPNMTRVLRDAAFWDVYHEHCSYFTPGALKNLFALTGFDVTDTWTDYDDQYLMITARPSRNLMDPSSVPAPPSEEDRVAVQEFAAESERRIAFWRQAIRSMVKRGERVVLWGSGSKAVAFLSALGFSADECLVEYAVDVNPYRRGHFIPGTGQEIVEPAFLAAYRPHFIIAMNSIYTAEIQTDLARHGVSAEVLPIETVEEVSQSNR